MIEPEKIPVEKAKHLIKVGDIIRAIWDDGYSIEVEVSGLTESCFRYNYEILYGSDFTLFSHIKYIQILKRSEKVDE